MQIIKKLVVGLLAVAMLLSTFTMLNTKSVCAKSKKVYYSGSFLGKVKDVDKTGIISKVKFTKTKMMVTGSLKKGNSKKSVWSEKAKDCKRKKRTFKLAKNVKFYEAGGIAGEIKDTKSGFVEFCNQLNKNPNGLGFWFVVKNGKVTKVVIAS